MLAADKIMFQIYCDTTYSKKYKVVYFTELTDHNREAEINRALAGELFFDGYIRSFRKDTAKQIIDGYLQRLNAGERVEPKAVQHALAEYLVD
jgi:hypothetical protein